MWVFGMVDMSVTPTLGYMEIVAQRDAATLGLPIIQQHVANGSTVWSDEWAAYNRIASLPNVSSHGVVNHSIELVNHTTGVHTRNPIGFVSKSSLRGCVAAMSTSL